MTEELDRWDDRNLRQWLHQHTSDQGVIDLFQFITVLECMTEHWWDHSASDNLFVRKMHFQERGTAAYSCWPGQGWDGMWADLSDAIREHGGELRLGTQVERVLIENHEVKGIAVARQPRSSTSGPTACCGTSPSRGWPRGRWTSKAGSSTCNGPCSV